VKARPITVDGDVAYVPLTHGQTAIIDAEDAPLVRAYSWHARKRRQRTIAYVAARTNHNGRLFLMHRDIMGVNDYALEVYHINGDMLDNRKANLTLCIKRGAKVRTR
jgi:hypothetical protein